MRIPITTYSSYITLSHKDAQKLFWKEYSENSETFFTTYKKLPHPQQSITTQTLNIENNGKSWEHFIQNIPIHFPFTRQTQVILTQQDAKQINLDAPITTPGNFQNAKWLKIIWPQSSIYLPQCTIILQPHLCISKSDAEHLWIRQNQKISIQIYTPNQPDTTFHEIKVKIKDNYVLDFSLPLDLAQKYKISHQSRGKVS